MGSRLEAAYSLQGHKITVILPQGLKFTFIAFIDHGGKLDNMRGSVGNQNEG